MRRSYLAILAAFMFSLFTLQSIHAEVKDNDNKGVERASEQKIIVPEGKGLKRTPWHGTNPFRGNADFPKRPIKGRVLGPGKTPVEGAFVYDWQNRHRAVTDNKGNFEFDAYVSDDSDSSEKVHLTVYYPDHTQVQRRGRPQGRSNRSKLPEGSRPMGEWLAFEKDTGDVGTIFMTHQQKATATIEISGDPVGKPVTVVFDSWGTYGGSGPSASGHAYAEREPSESWKAAVGATLTVDIPVLEHGPRFRVWGEDVQEVDHCRYDRERGVFVLKVKEKKTKLTKGRVADIRDDSPLAGVRVQVGNALTVTDKKGNFEAHGVPDKRGNVSVSAHDVYWRGIGDERKAPTAPFPVREKKDGDDYPNIIRLRPIVEVSGTISFEETPSPHMRPAGWGDIARTPARDLQRAFNPLSWKFELPEKPKRKKKKDKGEAYLNFSFSMIPWGAKTVLLCQDDKAPDAVEVAKEDKTIYRVDFPEDFWTMDTRYEDVKLKAVVVK